MKSVEEKDDEPVSTQQETPAKTPRKQNKPKKMILITTRLPDLDNKKAESVTTTEYASEVKATNDLAEVTTELRTDTDKEPTEREVEVIVSKILSLRLLLDLPFPSKL